MPKRLIIQTKEWINNNSELAIIVTFILLLIFAFYDAAAASAAAVGFCAFLATYWQAKISREHNRLSVRPKIEFEFISNPEYPVTIGIINHGLGPAILDEIIVVINGKKGNYDNREMRDELSMLCKKEGLTYTPIFLLKGCSLPVNKKYDLITFTNSTESTIFHRNAIDLINTTLNFEFKYKSMYDEEFETKLYSSDLSIEKNN